MADYTCEIGIAGHSGRDDVGIVIQVKDDKGYFNWTWFSYNGPRQMEMLTTALTALAQKFHVVVNVDQPDVNWSSFKSIYAAR